MNPSGKAFALLTGNRLLDATLLLLILGASVHLLLDTAGAGGLSDQHTWGQTGLSVLFLLASLTLLPSILLQFRRALHERGTLKQEPAVCATDPSPCEYIFFCKGTPQDVIPSCIGFMETHLSRYAFLHSFSPPHLSHTYLGKRGAASLFSPPWIKIGLVLLLLISPAQAVLPHFLTPPLGRIVVWVLAVSFWIPGFCILWSRPYQKLWLQLLEQEGCVQIRLTCASPFRPSKRNTLCRALESAVRTRFTCRSSGGLPPHHQPLRRDPFAATHPCHTQDSLEDPAAAHGSASYLGVGPRPMEDA